MIRINTESRYMGNNQHTVTYNCQVYAEPWWEKMAGSDDAALEAESSIVMMGLAESISNIEGISVEDALIRLGNIILALIEDTENPDSSENATEEGE